jgi:hypothetical protein
VMVQTPPPVFSVFAVAIDKLAKVCEKRNAHFAIYTSTQNRLLDFLLPLRNFTLLYSCPSYRATQ